MPVVEVLESLGSFEFELLGNVPREVLDDIEYFGHIAIVPGRMDPRQYGDATLDAARYVGVIRRIKIADDGRTNLIQDDIRIGGVGMNFWLGDDDNKGYVLETAQEFTSASFTTLMSASPTGLRPASVGAGTISGSVPGSYSGRHQWETPRAAIQFVCETMSTSGAPVSFKVNNRGNLDAGPESSLFVTTPTCVIMRKGTSAGEDMSIRAIPGTIDMDQDMEDFSTRVVMIAEADSESLATGSADIATVSPGTNVFKDIHGGTLTLTRLVSESDTLETMADVRAEVALRKVISPHRNLTLATEEYDIYGSFQVGDYIWVYDPDAGLIDTNNEIYIRGLRINPIKLQVTETDWPITDDYTIGYRTNDGLWYDLTDWVHFDEEATSKITIGDFERALNADRESVGSRVASYIPPDTSTPNAPVLSIGATVTYLDSNGFAKASQTLSWTTPTNTDSTTVTDGSHYEINVRKNGDTDWAPYNVGWGTNTIRLTDLSVGTQYQARVRASDVGNNTSAWSSTENFTTSVDSIAPSQPAAPTVAASTIAIQVKHQLGKNSGGTFNLESDLAELEVHLGTSSGFTPSASGTYIGSLRANQGMIAAQVPAVNTFTISNVLAIYVKVIAVDTSGNKSTASPEATSTALLVDNAHISDLTVSKVTAGTISADWIVGSRIKTADTGARAEMSASGFSAYNSSGVKTFSVNSANGDVVIVGDALYYDGAPAVGNLLISISGDGGTDALGNVYPQGLQSYSSDGTLNINGPQLQVDAPDGSFVRVESDPFLGAVVRLNPLDGSDVWSAATVRANFIDATEDIPFLMLASPSSAGNSPGVINLQGGVDSDPETYCLIDTDITSLAGNLWVNGIIEVYDNAGFNTYTPVLSNAGSATYTTRTGYWQRVGNMIYFCIFVDVNAAGSGAGLVGITAPTDIDRSTRQTVTCHLDNVSSALEGTGSLLSLASGSGNEWVRIRGRENSSLTGANLLAGCVITAEGWYRQA